MFAAEKTPTQAKPAWMGHPLRSYSQRSFLEACGQQFPGIFLVELPLWIVVR
jgi:hypothetical protein